MSWCAGIIQFELGRVYVDMCVSVWGELGDFFHPHPMNATLGHVRCSANNAVTWWRSVSVAVSDSQSAPGRQLRCPAGKSDRGRSKTERKEDPGERKTEKLRRGAKDRRRVLSVFSPPSGLEHVLAVTGLRRWDRILFLILVFSIAFTALVLCVSLPSIVKDQPHSCCSAAAAIPSFQRRELHAVGFSTLNDTSGEGDKLD